MEVLGFAQAKYKSLFWTIIFLSPLPCQALEQGAHGIQGRSRFSSHDFCSILEMLTRHKNYWVHKIECNGFLFVM